MPLIFERFSAIFLSLWFGFSQLSTAHTCMFSFFAFLISSNTAGVICSSFVIDNSSNFFLDLRYASISFWYVSSTSIAMFCTWCFCIISQQILGDSFVPCVSPIRKYFCIDVYLNDVCLIALAFESPGLHASFLLVSATSRFLSYLRNSCFSVSFPVYASIAFASASLPASTWHADPPPLTFSAMSNPVFPSTFVAIMSGSLSSSCCSCPRCDIGLLLNVIVPFPSFIVAFAIAVFLFPVTTIEFPFILVLLLSLLVLCN